VSVVVVTPPDLPVLSLALAKRQCRVDYNDDDELIQSLIDSATAWLDGPGGWLGRCLMPQTLELRQDSFWHGDWKLGDRYIWEEGALPLWNRWPFSRRIELPFPPFISLTSITFEDGSGVDQTLASNGWVATDEGVDPSYGTTWPSGRLAANAVRIRYQAGYLPTTAGASTVPAPIRHAIMLLVSHWYAHPDAVVGVENRDSSTPLPLGVDSLLAPYRVWKF
jgi:uncharacterized phiE125 gp8 family phage protein